MFQTHHPDLTSVTRCSVDVREFVQSCQHTLFSGDWLRVCWYSPPTKQNLSMRPPLRVEKFAAALSRLSQRLNSETCRFLVSRFFHDDVPIYDMAIFGERNDTFIVYFSFGFDQLFLPSLGFLRGLCCWRVTIS